MLAGVRNGRLPADILVRVPAAHGGPDVLLVEPAARAWKALVAQAERDGHLLRIGWPTSAYRPYADQERIFLDRYVPSIFGTRSWNGQRWRKKVGVAAAAVPGTSNHGLGLAIDLAEESDGDTDAESIDTATVLYLTGGVADRFGWSWEIQSERWHIRYVAGDQIPQAVLAHEASQEDGMTLLHDSDSGTWRVAVPGEGSAVVSNPSHWRSVIANGRATGTYESPYMSDLISKIRAERG